MKKEKFSQLNKEPQRFSSLEEMRAINRAREIAVKEKQEKEKQAAIGEERFKSSRARHKEYLEKIAPPHIISEEEEKLAEEFAKELKK